MYKISIIIPVFNVEDTLQNAFDSILNQSIGFENLEVIFVDDKSTDNSGNIIKKFSNKYDNVKAIILDENSGFAGKPRNIGIENATADYLMFLDSDDMFLEDACEILYKNITENDLEMVSGNYNINRDNETVRNNWNIIKLENGEFCEVKNVEENFNLLLTTPSVWSKIFKKEFILKENIGFLVGVPAQDLVFVSEALLKADGIKFINTPVVEYIPRQSGDEKSVTSKKSKSVLAGFIKSYTALLNIAKEYNKDYAWLGPRNLYFWIKQFVLSDLEIKDKIDLLYMANPLFEEFITSDKIRPPEFLEEFLDLISNKDFLNASKVSEKLDIFYDDKRVTDKIKAKKIFLMFFGYDIEIGGLAKATFNRANLLKKHGYDVSILNIDKLKNSKVITDYFHENNYLDKSIDLTNIYDYYSLKNTVNKNSTPKQEVSSNNPNIKNDESVVYDYYSKDNPEELIEKRHYLKNYYCIRTYFENEIFHEDYFTNDDFKFLSRHYEKENTNVTLKNRKLDLEINFRDVFEFNDYFVSEILLEYENKPFLINENSGIVPNFNNIDSSLAYKIASIHTNPYSGEHHYGSQIRGDFTILKQVNKLDYIVVLTEGLKNDLVKEFNMNTIKAIPNIIDSSQYSQINENKDLNKISIFARLSPEKNISDAIKAFEIVSKQKENARLEIFGRATTPSEILEEEKLHELVDELKLKDKVIFKGHSDEVNVEMSKSLATLFTSDFEGLGMVVLESMLNSTPVISYDLHYGPADFIDDGENGYLVDEKDVENLARKMIFLLDNPKKAIEMGKTAREKILHQINEENLFLKWEEVLKEVFINSQTSKTHLVNEAILKELVHTERVKIMLYRENHRLYRQNKLLKHQINSESKLKKFFKKIKRN
ncbi:glycosyltransferase [Methanobrevibacter sp.]|uniref:glycosyltransferase n=1 Tax=Methanobrevibacter sp. TaxID=66852 RepID=UPI00388FA358